MDSPFCKMLDCLMLGLTLYSVYMLLKLVSIILIDSLVVFQVNFSTAGPVGTMPRIQQKIFSTIYKPSTKPDLMFSLKIY